MAIQDPGVSGDTVQAPVRIFLAPTPETSQPSIQGHRSRTSPTIKNHARQLRERHIVVLSLHTVSPFN